MKPTAKKLILGLLLASDGQALSVRQFIDACALFDITENNVRVTLARLTADELLAAAERGTYQLGPAAEVTASQVAIWLSVEDYLTPWHGGYVAVHSGVLGRSDRKALKQRERALEMLGLRELDRGLYVRPDNFQGGVDFVRQRLHLLGLESEAAVFAAGEFDAHRQATIAGLWDAAALNRYYQQHGEQLETWMDRHTDMPLEQAAKESYLLGGAAIRSLVFDPWLPSPLVDAGLRHRFVETVKRFDETGKSIWNQLYHIGAGMPLSSTAHLSAGALQ